MAASSSAVRARRTARSRRRLGRVGAVGGAAALVLVVLPLLFAGSGDRLADGTRISGIDVGGLSPLNARRLLEGRATALADVPVTFTAAGRSFRLTPRELGVHVDWATAVAQAARQGGGIGVVRGYRRLGLDLFGDPVAPPVSAYGAAVDYELARIARAIDSPHRQARLVRRGLRVTIQPGATGRLLDLQAAHTLIVDALASFSRAPVALPLRADPPTVTVASLAGAQLRATRILSGPVTLLAGPTRLRLPRWRLATMLDLTTLSFAGPAADAYFARLERELGRPPEDARFAVTAAGGIRVVPSQPGVELDVLRSAAAVVAAAQRPAARVARLALVRQPPQRTTAEAKAMGITGTVGSYETIYGGDPNRIHNVQLVAHLIDGALIAPGATFSFNRTTGARTPAKGFRVAPVIVNGELQNGIGGGVCQVSTTVFNAAYEAGLPITERTNHALYISHYPLGRDATVDYPNVDLKFVNDTPHWLLLRTFVGPSSLVVTLYGTPQHRRVVTIGQPLRVVAPAPVSKTVDASLRPGQVVVDQAGMPAQSTSVERKVFSASGKLLSDQTWSSSYRAVPELVRVGPKKTKAAGPTTTAPSTTPR